MVILTSSLLPPNAMPFRLNSKSFIVTYPQCGLDKQFVLEWFRTQFVESIIGIRVGHELHEDGQDHLHVVFNLRTAYCTRNERCFDIEGHHPNIQSTRSLPKSFEYAGKDGDFVDYGVIPDKEECKWSRVINAATKEEALSLAKDASPRDYVLQYDKILSFCEQHFTNKIPPYEPQFTVWNDLPPQLQQFQAQMNNVSFSQFFELQHMRARSREP